MSRSSTTMGEDMWCGPLNEPEPMSTDQTSSPVSRSTATRKPRLVTA